MSEVMLVSGRVMGEKNDPTSNIEGSDLKKQIPGWFLKASLLLNQLFGIIVWTCCMWASSKTGRCWLFWGVYVFVQSYCRRNPKNNHLGCINETLSKVGLSYQPQLVNAGFLNHQQVRHQQSQAMSLFSSHQTVFDASDRPPCLVNTCWCHCVGTVHGMDQRCSQRRPLWKHRKIRTLTWCKCRKRKSHLSMFGLINPIQSTIFEKSHKRA